MKNFSIILAMLFLAFTVEAQNAERTQRSGDKKSTNTSVKKSSDRSSKARVAKSSSSTKASKARSSSSSKKYTPRKSNKSSSSSAVRSSDSRSRSTASQAQSSRKANRSSSNRDVDNRSTSSRKVNRESANRANSSRKVNRESNNRASSSRTVNRGSANRTNTSSRSVGIKNHRNERADRDNNYSRKTSDAASRKVYTRNLGTRVHRKVNNVHYTHRSLEYRRVHNPYHRPIVTTLYWNANMHNRYRSWYPDFNLWYYPYGYRIHTISAYDSYNYIGEVARIYGRVTDVWYSRETREYYLYIGGQYPYQDFTIILDARDAKRYSWNPERYFFNRDLTVTGLVSLYEDKPEMLIRKRSQLSIY